MERLVQNFVEPLLLLLLSGRNSWAVEPASPRIFTQLFCLHSKHLLYCTLLGDRESARKQEKGRVYLLQDNLREFKLKDENLYLKHDRVMEEFPFSIEEANNEGRHHFDARSLRSLSY